MQTLSKLVRRGSVAPPPLPPMYPSWGSQGWLLRQQSVQMIAGVPGTYKTMVLLNGLVNMRVPTLAFSNDSDDATIAHRLLGIATGVPCEQTEDWLRTDPQRCYEVLQQYDFLQWQFMPSPSLDDIWLETYAYGERYGMWPQLIVVDILGDVSHEGSDEWSALREVMRQAKVLARETKASVLLIHHCSDGTKGDPCPSRASVMGKVSAHPTLMLTLGKDADDRLHVACVKARHAASDATGRKAIPMAVTPENARVRDYTGTLGFIPQQHAEGEWWK